MASFQDLFTPIFIVVALSLFVGGIVVLQVLDALFKGSKNLMIIRIFCISIIFNIIILVFLVMSFSKVKQQPGPEGPTGNKGKQGDDGTPGGLQVCDKKFQTIEEKKTIIKAQNYLEIIPPLIQED